MSSRNGRSVRLRAEKRSELDVRRFARAIIALSDLLAREADGMPLLPSPERNAVTRTNGAPEPDDGTREADP